MGGLEVRLDPHASHTFPSTDLPTLQRPLPGGYGRLAMFRVTLPAAELSTLPGAQLEVHCTLLADGQQHEALENGIKRYKVGPTGRPLLSSELSSAAVSNITFISSPDDGSTTFSMLLCFTSFANRPSEYKLSVTVKHLDREFIGVSSPFRVWLSLG